MYNNLSLESFDEESEIIGSAIEDAITAIYNERLGPIVASHGFNNVDREAWYPLAAWLETLSDISLQSGQVTTFVSMGMNVAQEIIFPVEFADRPLKAIMMDIPEWYTWGHRGKDFGEVQAEARSEQHIRYTIRTPYPDDYFYGLIYGMMRRFGSDDLSFDVSFPEDGSRRDEGDDVTHIDVTWSEATA